MRLPFRRTNDSADSPTYLSLLNLHTPPFAAQSGAAFFYADAERTQYLDMLQHLTQYSEELLLVVGDEGLGKSTLLDKYLERGEEHWRLCRLNGEQGIDLDTLFARVAKCFAVELGKLEVPQLLDALRQHLDALLEQQLSVLVIDDAQALSDDALEMVFHLATLAGEHGRLIRVLLFADSAIEARLNSPRFAEIASPHRLQLKALQAADSSAYLMHRLQQAGYSGVSPFSADELKQIHRQSHGIPAQLNQAAHTLLAERTRSGASRPGITSNAIRMGVAATALIGTVLGMHERINDLLGGDAYSSVAVSAERPVLRLADKDNPWAVVIRDGESIQISCGPPAAQTVAVRPIPAAAPLDTQAVMKTPLIQPVSDLMDEGTGLPPAIIESPVAELPVVTTPQAEELPEPLPTVPPEKGDAPVSEEGSSVPLVVKPPLPSIAPALPEMANGGDEMAPEAAVEKLSLDSVLPDPVTGSEQPQIITILGSGLEEGSKVAVSWGGKVKALDSSQIVVRDPMHMELTLTTGLEPGIWAVQVSTPGQQRSNVLRFQVEAPKPDAVVEMAGTEVKPEKVDGEMPLAKPAETVPVKEETKPELPPEKPVKKTPVVKKAVPAKKAPQTKSEVIQGSQWVVVQPGGNYTLQLLASSERKALDAFVAEYAGLRAPLAGFEQQRSGKTLHVLIQGSYPDRAKAEAAVKMLPGKLKPWIRDFAGIKMVMTAPAAPAASTALIASGGIKDSAWVWSQKPTEYTIQLASASDEAAVESVMRGISLPGELAMVASQRNGKPWYALIYGRFASKEAAQGTVARLPASLKKTGPWIRRFSALHDEIGQPPAR